MPIHFDLSHPLKRAISISLLAVLPASVAVGDELRNSSDQNATRAAEISAIQNQTTHAMRTAPAAQAAKSDARVIGGQDASAPGQWEFTVNLTLRGNYRCGGVLVSPDIRGSGTARHVHSWRAGSQLDLWVLTAAHCLFDRDNVPITKDEIEIKSGVLDLNDTNRMEFDVIETIPHAGYKPLENFVNDIALLRVEATSPLPAPKANPRSIKLPNFRDFQTLYRPSVRFQVNGWGNTSDSMGDSTTSYLQTADIPYIDQVTCSQNYQVHFGGLPAGSFCAGWLEGGIDSCAGDSGGPIFFPGSVGASPYSNEPILTGLVSWGRGCALPGYPGVYTNVFSFLSWIEKNVVTVN
ncbi:S1 family serine peptidase [Tateyamaria sp. SN3-11]|uniref:S1 family serine peptidase n=1 Tax=Tateyamaria sp. SN3-11 TaxID=3092147 RepID=UPI0039ED6149